MSQVNEQTADYQLADLSPVLKASDTGNILLNSLPVWLSAQTRKSAGRGRSADNTLQYGVQKLREMILELAVRGKLVPQDSNDEPASVMLEKIAMEKIRLAQEGKIKKQKILAASESDKNLHNLPRGWSLDYLGNLSHTITKGTTPTSIGFSFQSEGVSFIKVENIKDGRINLSTLSQFISDETHEALGRSKLGANDILFSIAGTIGKTAIVYETDLPANTNQALAIIKGTSTCFVPSYLKIQLDSFVSEAVRDKARGGAMPNISLGDLQHLVTLIPPIAEQHRIVKKVDELMVLCDQLEQQQTDAVQAHDTLVKVLLDTLTQSENAEDFQQNWRSIAEHFDTLFTTESSIDQLKQTLLQLAVMGKLVPQDPNDEPASILLEKIAKEKAQLIKEGKIKKQKASPTVSNQDDTHPTASNWQLASLAEIATLQGGFAYKSVDFINQSEYQVIRMGNIRPDALRLENSPAFISQADAHDTEQYKIVPGDILLTMTGTKGKRDYLYSVLVEEDHLENRSLYLNQRLCKIGVLVCDPYYLNIALKSEQLLNVIYSKSTGTANQANISMDALSKWMIPVPPIKEQQRIVERLDELMSLCDQLKDRLIHIQSLQQQLADAVVEQAVQ